MILLDLDRCKGMVVWRNGLPVELRRAKVQSREVKLGLMARGKQGEK